MYLDNTNVTIVYFSIVANKNNSLYYYDKL